MHPHAIVFVSIRNQYANNSEKSSSSNVHSSHSLHMAFAKYATHLMGNYGMTPICYDEMLNILGESNFTDFHQFNCVSFQPFRRPAHLCVDCKFAISNAGPRNYTVATATILLQPLIKSLKRGNLPSHHRTHPFIQTNSMYMQFRYRQLLNAFIYANAMPNRRYAQTKYLTA